MKKLGLFIILIVMSIVAYAAVIYEYKAKDGKVYYTGGLPTALTATEKAQYKATTQANIDKGIVIPPDARELTKAQQRKDNTSVVVVPICKADEKVDTATNKCVARCLAPEFWNSALAKCETPVIPEPPIVPVAGIQSLPSVAVECEGNGGTCRVPSGITARVYFGAGGKYTFKNDLKGNVACNATNLGDPNTGTYNRCYYVDNKLLAKNLDPKGANLMPFVNTSLVPLGSAGFSGPMIKASSDKIAADEVGAFRISCEYSHMSNDDPIVYPGVPNATHHHTFFGNTGANAYSTNDTLRNSGNSSCAGGTLNRSGYWMPSLIDTSTGAPVKPSVVVVYYKGWESWNNHLIKPPPAGLQMISGNARPLSVADTQAEFYCQDLLNDVSPHWGKVWQGNSIKSCGGNGKILRMIVSFPGCWDAKNLSSPDYKSHMAFYCGENCLKADGKIGKTANGCPVTHPVLIPNITINADFPNLNANAQYRLASDNYSTAYPGGYSLHADWMNGWDEKIIERVVKNCLNSPKNCGGPNLGDGYTLYGVNQD